MMRLCTIVFPESSSSRTKEYTFKIPKMLYVREGDILRNPNYGDAPMKVVRVFDYPVKNVYKGYILKELLPFETKIESPSVKFNNNQTNNNMKERNIIVSLEEARNWYNSENQTLRKLSLQAYTEKELNGPCNFKEVLDFLGVKNLSLNMQLACEEDSNSIKLTKEIGNELTLHMKLGFIAKYFNGSWKPNMTNTKYFLAKIPNFYNCHDSIKLDNDYYIITDYSIMYPGVVYFQNSKDVRKAYEMLKDELN